MLDFMNEKCLFIIMFNIPKTAVPRTKKKPEQSLQKSLLIEIIITHMATLLFCILILLVDPNVASSIPTIEPTLQVNIITRLLI